MSMVSDVYTRIKNDIIISIHICSILIFKAKRKQYEEKYLSLAFGKNVSPLNKSVLTAIVFCKISQEFCFTLWKKDEILPVINPPPNI